MSRKLAAKTFQIPRTTLIYRIKNPEHNSRPGPSTILSEEEEEELEKWISTCCRKGFPKRKEDVISSVAAFLKKRNRAGRFKNGEKWFKLFLRRRPNISFRTPEPVTAASAAVSEKDVKGCFKQIEDYLQENNLFQIVLSDPSRVFNGDETNFLLCPKTGVVLAPKGTKNVYEVDSAPAKTSLTVMFTFGADGSITPPMVIFPNKRLSSDITSKIPSDWGIGLSDNGWMKSEVFHDYIETVLYPYLVKKGTTFPIILFVDGHKSHLTKAVSDLCTSLNIELIALYPNCTRMLQPADVAAFKPLKYGWQKSVLEWRRTHPSEALNKINFVPLLQKTIEDSVSSPTIINGFRATGLCPWDPNAVDYTKCLGKSAEKNEKSNEQIEVEEKVSLSKKEFVRIIGEKKLKEIEQNTEDIYLKRIWDFFNSKEILSTGDTEISREKELDTITHSTATSDTEISREKELDTILYSTATSDTEISKEKETDTISYSTAIEDMEVIISDDVNHEKTFCNFVPTMSNEVEISCYDQIAQVHAKTIPFSSNSMHKNADSDEDASYSQDVHVIAQVHTKTIPCSSNSIHKNADSDEDASYSQDVHVTNTITHIAEVHSKPTKQMVTQNVDMQHDYDRIDVFEDSKDPTISISMNVISNLTPVKLQDVLVLPKTPQRKGNRDTKRAPFVLTSMEWKAQEEEKHRIKKEKEEGIKKRKEERERKKQVQGKIKKTGTQENDKKRIKKKAEDIKKPKMEVQKKKPAQEIIKETRAQENDTNRIKKEKIDDIKKRKVPEHKMKLAQENEENIDSKTYCVDISLKSSQKQHIEKQKQEDTENDNNNSTSDDENSEERTQYKKPYTDKDIEYFLSQFED